MVVRTTLRLVLLLGMVSLVFPSRAHAYIDPGTGTYVLQMAIAGMLATAYVVKIYWRKIVRVILSPFRKGGEDEADGN